MSTEENKNKEKKGIIPAKIKTNELMANVVDKAAKTGKKSMELTAKALAQTASGSKAVADKIAQGARDHSDKVKMDNYNKRMKKYNPLFPEEYCSEEFHVPNIIRIVDDAVRRDIDVCQGAIGWREKKKDTEVLFLYDEFVRDSGLIFVPNATCDEIYYMDAFDRKRFIKLDYIFQKAHEEKMAELEHIAYSLGAKKCIIELEDKEVNRDKKKRNLEVKETKGDDSGTEGYSQETSSDSYRKRSSKTETVFEGNTMLAEPRLKWFAHDDNILNLIEWRFNGGNITTTKRLSGAASATMSKIAAYNIDVAVAGMGINQGYSMEDQSVKESQSKIVYRLEF